MNYKQRLVDKAVRGFVKRNVDSIWVVPNKRNKVYRRACGFVHHRTVVRVARNVLKRRGHI